MSTAESIPRTRQMSSTGDGPGFTPPTRTSQSSALSRYLEIVFLHKVEIAVFVAATMSFAWLALSVWPRTYESESKLLLRVGRQSVSLDPTATTGQTLMLHKTQDEEIRSALEILGSRQIAEQVVNQLSAGPILDGTLPADRPVPDSQTMFDRVRGQVDDFVDYLLVNSGVRDVISDREMAVRKVKKNVSIDSTKMSSVITVRSVSKTPEMAQALVKATTDAFLKEYLEVSRTDGSFQFFEQQCEALEAELTEVIAQKRKYMQDRNIVSIEANRAILKEQLTAVDRDLIVAQGELEQTAAEIKDLEQKSKDISAEIIANKQELTDSTWSGMRQSVYAVELLEKSLATKLTEEHPDLKQTRDQLKGAREILAERNSDRVNASTTPNPEWVRILTELHRLQTRSTGLRSIVAAKAEQHAAIYRDSHELLDVEQQMTEMEREIALKEASLRALQAKLEEARVIDELQSERISNVSVFQDATFVERPVSPRKRLLAAAAAMFAISGALGLAFFRETNNSTLRTADEVESILSAPVIARLPYEQKLRFFGRAGRRKRRRRRSRTTPRSEKRIRTACKPIVTELLLAGSRPASTHSRAITVGVLGCNSGCGASTVATALAVTSAQDCGLRTLLVDADLRSRSVSDTFDLNGAPGLAEFVAGNATSTECTVRSESYDLDLVSSVSPTGNRRFEIGPRGIGESLAELQRDRDLVIVDLPPASRPDQTVALNQYLDYVLVVVESRVSDRSTVTRLLRRLHDSDTDMVGVVLNKSRDPLPRLIRKIVTS